MSEPLKKCCFFLIFLFISSFFTMPLMAQRDAFVTARKVITPALLGSMVNILASDSMMGRSTPSPGQDQAADYIARQFKSMGLVPLQNNYFQPLGYCYLDLLNENILGISNGSNIKTFELKTDFIPYDITGQKDVEAPLVFCGYGITAPEFNYDDYKGMDVRGKIVLILRQEPGQTDSTRKVFNGKEPTKYSNLKEKEMIARSHGAIGILVVSGPLNYTSLKPRGFPWPSLSKTLPRDALPLIFCDDLDERLPMVQIGENVLNALLASSDSLKKIQEGIELNMQPASFEIPDLKVHLKTSVHPVPVGGKNVAGFLEGSDPRLKTEVLVIGAHYDHVGFIKEHKADSDYIFNGADDNASGTSGVLATAKAFTSMKNRPKRSVLFILFTGEELGLLGSSTYVRKPLIPLENTVAMINLDMIGRNHPDSLEIEGARQNPDLMKIILKQNKKSGMTVVGNNDEQMGGGSDHYNFYRKDIPSVFFFTGLHKDYHQVSDNPDRIDTVKNARVARLAFLTAWYIANDKHHYKLIKSTHTNEN